MRRCRRVSTVASGRRWGSSRTIAVSWPEPPAATVRDDLPDLFCLGIAVILLTSGRWRPLAYPTLACRRRRFKRLGEVRRVAPPLAAFCGVEARTFAHACRGGEEGHVRWRRRASL